MEQLVRGLLGWARCLCAAFCLHAYMIGSAQSDYMPDTVFPQGYNACHCTEDRVVIQNYVQSLLMQLGCLGSCCAA